MLNLLQPRALILYGVVATGARAVPLLTLVGASLLVTAVEFGVLAGSVAAFTLCVGIAEGGLDSAASLLIGRKRSSKAVVSSLLSLRLAVAALLSLTVLPLLLLQLAPDHGASLVVVAVVALLLASIAATCRLRVRVASPRREMGILTCDRLVSAVPFVLGLLADAEVPVLILLFVSGQALGSLLTVAVAHPPLPQVALTTELLREAFPFIVSTIAANVTWRVAVITLGLFGATTQAGYLATAIYPVQAIVLISAGSAPLVLIQGRDGLDQLRPRRAAVVVLVVATVIAAGTVALVGPLLPVPQGTVMTMAVLMCVIPAAFANPLVGASIRVHGQARLVAGAAAAGATVAASVSLTTTRASVGAAGIVAAEVTVLIVMLLLRARHGALKESS